MKNSPLVYAVVLNWNSCEDTAACIQSLEALDYPHLKIVIVDNASPDGSGSILKKRFPSHSFIQTGRNKGYGDGNNFGIRYAVEKGAEYVWIVNPDIIAEKDSLKGLVEVIDRDPSIGICGPRILLKMNDRESWSDGLAVVPEKGYLIQGGYVLPSPDPGAASPPQIRESDCVLGCSMLVRKNVFDEVGLIRDDFFMYFEEVEFNLRAKNRGWKIVVCPQVRNWHYHKGDLRTAAFYFARNTILISRIKKKYLFRSAAGILLGKGIFHPQKRRPLEHFFLIFSGVLAGMAKPLKPVPQV